MHTGILIAAATALTFGSTATAAPFTARQLLQLTQKPAAFKPTASGTANVNTGVKPYFWQWGAPLVSGVELTRLNGNIGSWKLDLSDSAYPLAKIAPQRQLLATLNDPVSPGPIELYVIKSGVFKGQYLEQQRFSDGGVSITVKTKVYAIMSARGSELQQGGTSQIYSYPLGTFLLYKSAFCATDGAVCK